MYTANKHNSNHFKQHGISPSQIQSITQIQARKLGRPKKEVHEVNHLKKKTAGRPKSKK